MKPYWSAVFIVILVAGCAKKNNIHVSQPVQLKKDVNLSVANTHQDTSTSHMTQCKRDLESMRTVNSKEYQRYVSQFDDLMKTSAGFLTVKDDVSPEVAELARPRFQFALVNLCYRIKDALAQTLINQAGGH